MSTNIFVINGKTYSTENVNGNWIVFMDGKDIAEFATERLANVWIKDRARNKNLSTKTEKLINSL